MRHGPTAVVGATGFIGSRLVSHLRQAGHPVAGFSRSRPPMIGGRPAPGLRDAEVVYFLAPRMSPSLAAHRPDHVAGERSLLLDVIEGVGRGGRRPTFVLASSGTVYAPHGCPPYAETAPIGPCTAYGTAKHRLEQDLREHVDDLRPVALRIGNVYGPGQSAAHGFGVLPHWLSAASRHRPVRLIGDPLTVRDYVYVDDVAELLGLIADPAAEVPPVLNVGSGTPTTLVTLLDVVSEVVGRELEVAWEDGRASDRQVTYLDPALAFSTLGWQARTALVDGVRRCWDRARVTRSSVPAGERA